VVSPRDTSFISGLTSCDTADLREADLARERAAPARGR
jgi:hypothetical protein